MAGLNHNRRPGWIGIRIKWKHLAEIVFAEFHKGPCRDCQSYFPVQQYINTQTDIAAAAPWQLPPGLQSGNDALRGGQPTEYAEAGDADEFFEEKDAETVAPPRAGQAAQGQSGRGCARSKAVALPGGGRGAEAAFQLFLNGKNHPHRRVHRRRGGPPPRHRANASG